MKQFAELEATINEHHQVKITESLSLAWQAFKRQPGLYIAYLFVVILASVVLSFIPLASTVISPFIVIGFSAFLYEENVHKDATFNNFFKPFQKFGNVFLTYLLTLVAYIVACSPLMLFGGMEFIQQLIEAQKHPYDFHPVFTSSLILGSVATVILCIITAVLLSYATFFAYFYSVKPMEAIKLSIQMGSKNFLHLIMLFIFSGFIAMIGVVAIIIGLLVTIPVAYLMMYFTFAGITKLETEDEPQFDFERK
jgi:hypothetical protein